MDFSFFFFPTRNVCLFYIPLITFITVGSRILPLFINPEFQRFDKTVIGTDLYFLTPLPILVTPVFIPGSFSLCSQLISSTSKLSELASFLLA